MLIAYEGRAGEVGNTPERKKEMKKANKVKDFHFTREGSPDSRGKASRQDMIEV